MIKSNICQSFATENSFPVAFGHGTRVSTNLYFGTFEFLGLDCWFIKQLRTGLTHVANSPGPLETITTAADSFEIAVNIIN